MRYGREVIVQGIDVAGQLEEHELVPRGEIATARSAGFVTGGAVHGDARAGHQRGAEESLGAQVVAGTIHEHQMRPVAAKGVAHFLPRPPEDGAHTSELGSRCQKGAAERIV